MSKSQRGFLQKTSFFADLDFVSNKNLMLCLSAPFVFHRQNTRLGQP